MNHRCVEEEFLHAFQGAKPGEVPNQTHAVISNMEAPGFARDVITDDLDPAGITNAKLVIMGKTDILDAERIEPHHFRSDRIDCYLVGTCKHVILNDREHCPRTG